MNINSDSAAIRYPSGSAIIDQLKKAEVQFIVSVPDIVTSNGLLWPISEDPDFKLVRVCKEDEGVSICGAMSYNNTRALLLMQQTGLMDSLNAIRAIGMDYQLPVCMMVGLQGKEPERAAVDSDSYGVNIIEPVLQAMQISYKVIEQPEDVDTIADELSHAYQTSSTVILILGREPTK
ncbi:MAG: decarboxylase [Gammaproteobacteria bacterium]|nr:decarboxylase [Gammaproteobacteria bacterium]